MPKQALYAGHRVRVLNYVRSGVWRVLDNSDTVKFIHRDRLTFLP